MMFDFRGVKIYYGDKEVTAGYLGTTIFYGGDPLPWVLASDNDFSGTADGSFVYIGNDPYVEIPHVIKGVNVTSYKSMFKGSSVLGVKSTNKRITDVSTMFHESKGVSLDLKHLDTSSVTTMRSMFYDSSAKEIDVSGWDTSSVTTMRTMFFNSSATSLDLSGWDTSSVTSMISMFERSAATSLDLSGWDTSSVTTMSSMFERSAATSLDLSGWDTSSVTSMISMFERSAATSLDLSSFTLENRTSCSWWMVGLNIDELDISGMDFVNYVVGYTDMFYGVRLGIGYALNQANADWLNARATGTPFVVKEEI